MDEDIYGYLALMALTASAILMFIGSLRARQGPPAFGPKLMSIGSLLLLMGTISLLVLIIARGSNVHFHVISAYFGLVSIVLFLLGPLLFFIGFVSFCARWGATGKRRKELIEITSALTAIQATKNDR